MIMMMCTLDTCSKQIILKSTATICHDYSLSAATIRYDYDAMYTWCLFWTEHFMGLLFQGLISKDDFPVHYR